ncbi:MAG TPA: GLUG motif-containing protein [Sedimentisphaerales bacterium]|nr:GLUG motif-containing protein [Sedimentisphaerales bacterium]HRS13048.1 GLUG motif-containing protein [Sedimentisphaerales bacterium]HRV49915.1 GLUG motif-containing protein [Sedimentisphaerales bacterium]
MVLTLLIPRYAVAYSGGEGTRVSPYVLSCRKDIIELASRPADRDKSFVLTADVDLEGVLFEQAIVAPNIRFIPSFNEYDGMYTGCFNGNGHVIENLSIVGDSILGFFGGIGSGGRVVHLGLKNARIEGPSAGAVGMLAGLNMGSIIGCYTEGFAAAYDFVGGLVGYQYGGRIIDCFSRGRVEGIKEAVGGLVGAQGRGRVERCYAASVVFCEDPSWCGGLVGDAPSTPVRGSGSSELAGVVLNSFWDVEVSGLSMSNGGFGLTTEQMHGVSNYTEAGWDFAEEQDNGIVDMWAHPDANDYPVLSSFVGLEPVWLRGDGSAARPYVISSARELAAMSYYGGYFALDTDIDLSGVRWSAPVLMQLTGGFDGRGHCICGFHQEGSCGLFGTIGSGATVANLCLKDSEVRTDDGVVGCLAGENHGLIANCSVTGIVTGGVVTGGLVGRNEGTISECSVAGVVEGHEQAGGLVGENAEMVINSFSEGAVAGDTDVGGLAGLNSESIRSCFSTASVVGYANLGGLCGSNGGIVTDCYARGAVAGANNVGGLIGRNSRDVQRCYSTGTVRGLRDVGGLIGHRDSEPDSVVASFWDVDASQMPVGASGTGLATAQMQHLDTFLDAGWDFVDEADNGTEDLWRIGPDNYPELTLSLILPQGPPQRTR